MVPPVSLVARTLHYLKMCRGRGVLVAPCWPSAAYWPILQELGSRYATDFLKVKGNRVLSLGHNKNSLLGSPDFAGYMLAVGLDCS